MVYEELIKELNRHRIEYVVAGGVAMVLHGVVRMTADFDIILNLEHKNLFRFLSVLTSLGYRPRVPVTEQEILDPEIREKWIHEKNMRALSFYNPSSPLLLIDVILHPSISFSQIKKGAILFHDKGYNIPLVSIDDMIKLKTDAGRPQDLADVKALKEIKKRRKT